jgi:hypothetical protein
MKKQTASRCLCLAAFLFAVSLGQAQTSIIPQIVDGGPWLTTIAITNTSASTATASLIFFQETGGGNTASWPLGFDEMTTTQVQSLVLQGGNTLFLHTPGTAANTTIGWGQLSELDALGTVVAYAVFTQRVPGRSDQDGTAVAAAATNRILVPFDNTNGAVTSMAIANTTTSSEAISVGIRTGTGIVSPAPAALILPAQGHSSFTFPTQFTATAGQSGLAEFYSASGSFSILALRFQAGAFTTAPVYSATGPPIIASIRRGPSNIILAGLSLVPGANVRRYGRDSASGVALKSKRSVLVRTCRCPAPTALPSVTRKIAPSVVSPGASFVCTSATADAVAAARSLEAPKARAAWRRDS